MSAFETENGRTEVIGAPETSLEKIVEFDKAEDAVAAIAEMPSKHDPEVLKVHVFAGHELIPINGKQPVKSGWRQSPALTASEAMARLASGRNIGVRLRGSDLVVDVDPRHFVEGDDPLARLRADFSLPDAPVVLTGGGGWHFYFRKPEGVTVVDALPKYKGVEFKSLGRQVVAAGSIHPDTGRLYGLERVMN